MIQSESNKRQNLIFPHYNPQAGLRFAAKKYLWPTDLSKSLKVRDYGEKTDPQVFFPGENILDLPLDLIDIIISDDVSVNVDLSKKYQKIIGFGGAFTGSVSYNLDQLSQELQDHLYKSYYSQSGIGYNFMRIPIGKVF